MKRTVMGVDQQAAIAEGLDLKEIVFLDWFGHWAASGTMQHKEIDGDIYWWISRQKVLKDLPILGLKDGSRVSRFVSRLIDKGFLERRQVANADNRGKRSYVRTTPKWSALSFDHVQESARGKADHVHDSARENPRPRADFDTSDTPTIRDTHTIRDRVETKVADAVIDYLNVKAEKRFRHTKANRERIIARLREGFSQQDCEKVIDTKVSKWLKDDAMNQYLRPATLFAPTKFEGYLNEKPARNDERDLYRHELPGTRDYSYGRV